MAVQNKIISIYTEATPNPATMKFVLNRMLFAQNSVDFPTLEEAKEASPLAVALFENFSFVSGVFIMNNFVSVTKNSEETEWFELATEVREFIRQYLQEEKTIVNREVILARVAEQKGTNSNEIVADDSEVVQKIKATITKYVQPAVEMDGGSIVFHSFDDGIVKLGMQGACSGCPSSTITLKAGIEGLLKRMIPEVKSVEASAI